MTKVNNSDIALCDYEEVYENEKSSNYQESNSSTLVLSNIEALWKIYDKKGWNYVIAWNKLYKKYLFDDIRFPIGKIHEDEMIAHEVLYKANKITYNNKKLYYYLQRENSIMSNYSIKRLDGVEALYERLQFIRKEFPHLYVQEKLIFCYTCIYHYQMILRKSYK